MKKPLGPTSSARQLWAEVERLRGSGDDERVAELTTEVERARAREAGLLSELGAARAQASSSGVAAESVAGKPALAKARDAWGRFADAVLRLPETRAAEGFDRVRVAVAKNLVADMELFDLAWPRSRSEARERDRLRRFLTNPAWLDAMSDPHPAHDLMRSLYLAQVVRAYFRPSVWRIYEKASDEGIRDGLGTVYK